jgi:hypothetical protein
MAVVVVAMSSAATGIGPGLVMAGPVLAISHDHGDAS